MENSLKEIIQAFEMANKVANSSCLLQFFRVKTPAEVPSIEKAKVHVTYINRPHSCVTEGFVSGAACS